MELRRGNVPKYLSRTQSPCAVLPALPQWLSASRFGVRGVAGDPHGGNTEPDLFSVRAVTTSRIQQAFVKPERNRACPHSHKE